MLLASINYVYKLKSVYLCMSYISYRHFTKLLRVRGCLYEPYIRAGPSRRDLAC